MTLLASLISPIAPDVRPFLFIVLCILVFFTSLFSIWRFFRDDSFVRLMLTRTYSWWAILVLGTLFFCISAPIGHIALFALSVQGFREIMKNATSFRAPYELLWMCYFVFAAQFIATSQSTNPLALMIIPFGGMILVTIFCILFEPVETTVQAPPFLVWTMILTGSGFAHLSSLLSLPNTVGGMSPQGLLIYFIFLTQFNDVLQFIWGTLFGRRKISPVISPNKTWEGLVGAVLTSACIAYFLRFLTPFTAAQSIFLGFILPIFGFWGDLTISALKRNLKVKDMGVVIPGHGGVLDRVDSILLSAIVYYYLISFWLLNS